VTTTRSSLRTSGRTASSGCASASAPPATEASTSRSFLAYGRAAEMAWFARENFAVATIFMARVICWVFATPSMRLRISRRVGMAA